MSEVSEITKVAMLLKTAARTIQDLENRIKELENNKSQYVDQDIDYGDGIGVVVDKDDYSYETNPKEKFDSIFG
jgi:hypothetical protein